MDLATLLTALGIIVAVAVARWQILENRNQVKQGRPHKEHISPSTLPEEQTQRLSEDQAQKSIIEFLIEQEILATRETHREKVAICRFDDEYWTNLNIKFKQLEQNDHFINEFAAFIRRYYLGNNVKRFVTVDPDNFIDFKNLTNDVEPKTRGTVKKIIERIGIPEKSRTELRDQDKIVLIAGIFSKSLKIFMSEFSSNIHLAVILLAPERKYFIDEKIIKPNKVRVLVSRDTLEKVSENKRKIMIAGAIK